MRFFRRGAYWISNVIMRFLREKTFLVFDRVCRGLFGEFKVAFIAGEAESFPLRPGRRMFSFASGVVHAALKRPRGADDTVGAERIPHPQLLKDFNLHSSTSTSHFNSSPSYSLLKTSYSQPRSLLQSISFPPTVGNAPLYSRRSTSNFKLPTVFTHPPYT